jgi:hypothetical protein
MVPRTRKQVLVTRVEDSVYRVIADLLRQSRMDLHRAGWDSTTLELIQSTPFDVVIIGYPVSDTALGRFLESARSEGSACRRAALVLISPAEHEQAARAMLGKGANRVIPTEALKSELERVVAELARPAPRLPVRAPATIKLYAEDGRPLRVMAQIENISTSGMLLRGITQFPVGTTFDFEISVPGEAKATSIRGTAEITRATDPAVEKVEGVGVRFVSFVGSDKVRLGMYLDRSLP